MTGAEDNTLKIIGFERCADTCVARCQGAVAHTKDNEVVGPVLDVVFRLSSGRVVRPVFTCMDGVRREAPTRMTTLNFLPAWTLVGADILTMRATESVARQRKTRKEARGECMDSRDRTVKI